MRVIGRAQNDDFGRFFGDKSRSRGGAGLKRAGGRLMDGWGLPRKFGRRGCTGWRASAARNPDFGGASMLVGGLVKSRKIMIFKKKSIFVLRNRKNVFAKGF